MRPYHVIFIYCNNASNLSHPGFSVREELETEQDRIQYTSRCILDNIGINIEESSETFLEIMLEKFNGRLPSTKVFSEFARSTIETINPDDGYDEILMAWIEREEILFRTFEKHQIAERLSKGFDGNTDDFLSFSLSVLNRRKSRMGLSLENHLESLFNYCEIKYSRNPITENRAKPDFIFPVREQYFNPNFKSNNLTMLGVKSTCKDRWRQILSEADRIPHKHLFTLQPSISINQTNEMQNKQVQLVVPSAIHESYYPEQQKYLVNLSDFIRHITQKQSI